eukprot:TRINITY_DN113910_c0_g1_i1.p1 TRINITY_DN113910_c0_g1~~TRINITY_DN113910_c0_g1_i1.p1  ORF type:complete len:334 (+),score=24.94 TRINITY_DN113910_c0_g1_i1:34-1035(+)
MTISEDTRKAILLLYQQGMTPQEIAVFLTIGVATVYRWLDGHQPKKTKIKPSKYNGTDLCVLLGLFMNNRGKSLDHICELFEKEREKHICRNTASEYLDLLAPRTNLILKPVLTEENKAVRLALAKKLVEGEFYPHSPLDFIWTDEKLFPSDELYSGHITPRQVTPADRFKQITGKGYSQMCLGVWIEQGSIRLDIPQDLKVNGGVYVQVWLDKILPWLRKMGRKPPFVVMMDNAPAHQVSIVQDILEAEGVRLVGQPANSPDMQVVEQAWSGCSQVMHHYPFGNAKEFWESIQCAWTEITGPKGSLERYLEHWMEVLASIIVQKGDNKIEHA